MNPSLSVILPVCNAGESLGPVVGRLVELLPDLAGSFEILIVDDASSDHTPEIADEWRRAYPQVRVVRHGWSWGTNAAVRTGRLAASGRHTIIVAALAGFDPREIVRQWQRLNVPAEQRAEKAADDSQPLPLVRRTEPAHGKVGQREPSFLRHLRQLSEL
jgi:glycosyltransferase involved in cell wall biosynthesis